ncbi:MAG: glycosyltransferase, partial [Desulforhabdus sp.]|nr:glycosyltransferase [Desulforhabdus sp.]
MSSRGQERFYRIAVLDMQPIDPPVGGGRLRLFGLYHNLGNNLSVNYVGSYDWPGASSRKHRLSTSLMETDIPLSDAHFEVNNKWSRFVHGRTIIDSVFGMMGHLSVEYMKAVRNVLAESDVVVFSHPWVYPLVRTLIEDLKLVVLYDAQNFEGLLRMELLDDGSVGTEISKHVIITEFELAHRADGILACSKEDCRLFKSIYGIDDRKLHLVPNGVYSSMIIPPSPMQKSEAKAELGLKGEVAIFIGSMYKPNVEAAKVICASLAPALPNVNFIICGGVSEAQGLLRLKSQIPHNVHFVGPVTEQKKKKYLWAADLAVNPMSSGSGTNIKMFDFMTAGLPVVSTPVGARGIEAEEGTRSFLVCDLADFPAGIESVIKDDTLRAELSQGGRLLVKSRYSWEDISPRLGSLITEMMLGRTNGKANASFSPEYPSNTLSLVKIDHHTTLSAGSDANKTLGLITPWGIRCGISEYSRYLSRGLAKQNIACRVFASKNEQLEQVNENCNNVFIDWSWRYGDINVDRIIQGCKTKEIGNINIQYHPNFFSEPTLVNIAQRCAENEINLSVTLHNTLDMNLQSLLVLSKMPVKLLVHSQK